MGISRRRPGLSPDRALEINLDGSASGLQWEGLPHDDIVRELRAIMGDRTDLGGIAAGRHLSNIIDGSVPSTDRLYAAALLGLAGADLNVARETALEIAERMRATSEAQRSPR